MTRVLRVALAQINPTVGDIEGNAAKIIEWAQRAASESADIVAFPELALTGYPPEDLVLKPDFVQRNKCTLDCVAATIGNMTAIIGFIDSDVDVYNAAAIIQQGRVVGVYHKCFLPNYSVFDEQRYFKAGSGGSVFLIRGVRVGVTVCEDIWYPTGPASEEAAAGAELIVNINASPFSSGRPQVRERMLRTRAQDEIACLAFVNTVGGQDELVFEGGSMAMDSNGAILARGKEFGEDMVVADFDIDAVFGARLRDTRRRQMNQKPPLGEQTPVVIVTPLSEPAPEPANERHLSRARELDAPVDNSSREIYKALVLGTRDYIRKNGFDSVVIGLSGGIDSSLTAAIAVDAVGADKVVGVSMPSEFSSEHSKSDAALLADNLGIQLMTVPIESIMLANLTELGPVFAERESDVTEENLQARIRGNLLMALSNKFGWLVLTTGNKSETAVGFSTLYGDTAGGFAVLKDVYKTMVFHLARYRNQRDASDLIPADVIRKEPSAELRAEQRDSDRLPEYAVLDPILELYIEDERSIDDIVDFGHDRATVESIVRMVDRAEYKRRQGPPGPRVSRRAFGKDRRLPITNGYRG